jgi:hypothetical protein
MPVPPLARRPAAVALLALAAFVACKNPVKPADVEGIYALQSVGSHALPAEVAPLPVAGAVPTVYADTIRLGADRTGTRTLVTSDSTGVVRTTSGDVEAEVHGPFLTLSCLRASSGGCFSLGPVRVTADGLTFDSGYLGTVRYARISDGP